VKYLPDLFERNRAWASGRTARDPDYFARLCRIQRPSYLWIGCADSRVPANEIVGLAPGELFVHRNVANLVRSEDPNAMAVVEYAVEALGVSHIIVCGHYGCGGVRAALDGTASGTVGEWLAPLRSLAASGAYEKGDPEERWHRLCEANVVEQVRLLRGTAAVQRRWASGPPLALHGWIYDLRDGLLRDLQVTVRSADEDEDTT
jgi:carbonic anhydrase